MIYGNTALGNTYEKSLEKIIDIKEKFKRTHELLESNKTLNFSQLNLLIIMCQISFSCTEPYLKLYLMDFGQNFTNLININIL